MTNLDRSLYDRVGGEETFQKLVDIFYDQIEQDPILRSMFPDDLEPGKKWQRLFLIQYFGGPPVYAEERGHPRLRMRHAPYPIHQDAGERWLKHMLFAIDEVSIAEPDRTIMREYFQKAAPFMVNHYRPEGDE
ncbi:globin [Anaerolineales bacterium]